MWDRPFPLCEVGAGELARDLSGGRLMDTRHFHCAQDRYSPQQLEAAQAPEDRRWPGVFMVLMILVGLVWPLGGMAAAVAAYLVADREQAVVLFAVAAAAMVLRWMLGE